MSLQSSVAAKKCILISIRLSLGLNGVSWLQPGSTRSDWWEAHLSVCMLTLMFAILFTLFPRRMDKYKLVDDELIDRGLLPTLGRVVRNKTVLVQSAALSFLYAAVFSFIRFDADFVQAQFHIETVRQDPRASRAITDLFRSLVIIFFVAIFRTRFSVRRTDGVKATTAARVGGVVAFMVAVPFAILAIMRCDIGDVGGPGREYEQPWCSTHCGCASQNYGFSPVCAVNTSTTYFSPCHAGCRSYEDLNGFLLFGNCACGGGVAARGACSLASCLTIFNFYQFVFALVLAFAGASLLMQGMVLLRSVLVSDKAVAIGASFATIALLSHVPGFLVYMLISHLMCAFSYNGGCLLHNPTLWSMAVLSASLSVVSGILSLIASRVAKGPIH
ncbi:solute carrier organic anion transporter family member 6C1-like [Choristoneura fumiferana]|uniref:solute carrier organic anion transporter family member 6C1-like n=1 Tax=Choristoneura fumiferana TaxID=7141 RepID=UPI003D15CE7C